MVMRGKKLSIGLPKEQVCYLDSLALQAQKTGGKSLSRTAIMRVVLRVASRLNVDVCKVRGEKELSCRISRACKQYACDE